MLRTTGLATSLIEPLVYYTENAH